MSNSRLWGRSAAWRLAAGVLLGAGALSQAAGQTPAPAKHEGLSAVAIALATMSADR